MIENDCNNCHDMGVTISVKCPCCNKGDGPKLSLVDVAPDLLKALEIMTLIYFQDVAGKPLKLEDLFSDSFTRGHHAVKAIREARGKDE